MGTAKDPPEESEQNEYVLKIIFLIHYPRNNEEGN